MRNLTGFAFPVRFRWKVARAGYQWVDTVDGRRIYAKDALRPDWQSVLEEYEATFQPLEERTGLFRELAEFAPSEEEVLKFANRFGLLDSGGNLQVPTEYGRATVHAESLEFWKGEILALKFAVESWDVIVSGSAPALARLYQQLDSSPLPLAARRASHLDDDDPAKAVLSAIRRLADARLQNHVETRLLFRSNLPRLDVCLQPVNLLGALWLQFALAMDAQKAFTKCAQCGAPFEISRAPKTGKRPDARFCGVRCRVNHYRGRVDEARRLRSRGKSPQEIARELNTRVTVIKGWLEETALAKAPKAPVRGRRARRSHLPAFGPR